MAVCLIGHSSCVYCLLFSLDDCHTCLSLICALGCGGSPALIWSSVLGPWPRSSRAFTWWPIDHRSVSTLTWLLINWHDSRYPFDRSSQLPSHASRQRAGRPVCERISLFQTESRVVCVIKPTRESNKSCRYTHDHTG